MAEWRIFGPPGTGKTSALAKWITDTIYKRGADSLIAMSFTRAAAAEIAGRDIPIERSRVGTLHAMAYRSLGGARVVDKDAITEWNRRRPEWALSAGEMDIEDGVTEAWGITDGDRLFNQIQVWRARMVGESRWPNITAREFYDAWNEFKSDIDAVDFTDMIEIALNDVDYPPGNPSIIFVDEVQDLTKLEIALARKWGNTVEHLVMAGDDDQCLYLFKGATPDAFLDPPVDESQKRVLRQSWRVPYQVQVYAQAWVEKVTRREPKAYAPRDTDGNIRFESEFKLYDAATVVSDIEKQLSDMVYDDPKFPGGRPKTFMILTTCSYMLEGFKKILRARGLPFENKYRRTRGDWNPLRSGAGVSTAERLLAFIDGADRGYWTGAELKRWVHVLKTTGNMERGAKAMLDTLNLERPVSAEMLARIFRSEVLPKATSGNIEWLSDNALAANKKTMDFPLAVIFGQGADALRKPPQITIGTIHSVKGGEADDVYVFPDVSNAGWTEWQLGGIRSDAIIRQFYVAFTRARDTLVVCGQGSPFAIPLPRRMPKMTELTI